MCAMFIEKVDEEISMRMLSARDAERLFLITDDSRAYLREWLPWVDDNKKVSDSLDFIKNGFQIYAERTGMVAGIFYKGDLVGIGAFDRLDWTNRIAYIGYWISKDFQGNGIITKVVRKLTDYAFTEFGLNRVDIRVASKNKKSQAIPERLGFEREGTLRQVEWLYDRYVDHIVYGMLKSNWYEKDKVVD